MSISSFETTYFLQNALLSSKISKKIDCNLSVHGISFTEYMVLHSLNESQIKTIRRVDLAESIGISASGVTRLLAPMEKNSLVEKEVNPRDARQSLVKLSEAGKRIFDEASVSFDSCAKDMLKALSLKQLQTLIELSGRIGFSG